MRSLFERLIERLRELRARPKLVRSPTVLQMEAVECGAASLGIVLAHHGCWVALEELRLACGVSRDGSKASNIVKAARKYGLKAKGLKTSARALTRIQPPCILHWNFNHFVVLDGIRGDRVYLNDPASGPRTVSHEELDESYTGVALSFEPGDELEPLGSKPSFLPALARRLRGARAALLLILLAGLLLVVPQLASPALSKAFIDSVLLKGNTDWLLPLVTAMGAAAVLIWLLTWLQQNYLLRLEARTAIASSGQFLWHVLRLPVEFFNQRYAGDISGRVRINDRVAQLLSRELATNFLNALMVVFFLLLMFRFDAPLTLVGVAVVSLNVAALHWVSRKRVDGSRRLLQEQGKIHGTAIGGLSLIETLKATGGESDFFSRWAGYQAKVVNIRQDLERYTQFLGVVPPLLAALNTALILGVGSLRVMAGRLSIGELVAFQALMLAFLHPVSRLVDLGGKLQTVEGDMNRLDDVLRYPPKVEDEPDGSSMDEGRKLAGHLRMRDVSFGYSRLDPPLIDDFVLDLEPGARIALVGGSGSGKSTVARMIAGLYAPWSGEILFDGKPRTAWSRSILNSSIVHVDQSVFLFEGSVRQNLTVWDATVPFSDVVAAAQDAAIHNDISARPGGYDSPVEEGGRNFSGGQRQRLEIARALVGSPSILILDEATSALDPSTEQRIDQSLRRRGSTCLIIAHRLSTIRDADEIVVMDGGRIVERGTHDELAARSGTYAQLISMY